MPKFSIIVPVYNVEDYLERCLDSIISQTFSNIEIICVDDGSTDNSGNICEEYADKEQRISVIHKENEGPAAARNDGLENIQGAYVSFVDCDDWLEPEMYTTMLQALNKEQADIIICGYTEDYAEKNEE